jgi:hypothetical protein
MIPLPFKQKPQILVREALRMAKRFVLDDDAVRYFAEMIRDIPEVIAMAHEFALRPFDVMYVEIPNFKLFYEVIGRRMADPDADERIGYLFSGPDVYVLADRQDDRPALGPVSYTLGRPIPAKLWPELMQDVGNLIVEGVPIETDSMVKMVDAFFWGGSIVQVRPEFRAVLRENHGLQMLVDVEHPRFTDEDMSQIYNGSSSDMRNIIGLLLFLNQTRDVQYIEELGHHKGFIRNKPSAYLKHSIIRMKISPMPILRKKLVGESGGLWRREHDVRGHFCHDKTARERQCLHDWTEYDVNQWRCKACGGLRWWRREHRRGHREKGRVSQEYQVTA